MDRVTAYFLARLMAAVCGLVTIVVGYVISRPDNASIVAGTFTGLTIAAALAAAIARPKGFKDD